MERFIDVLVSFLIREEIEAKPNKRKVLKKEIIIMGKVCGCGCRAGKVKSQTPKVPKKEKEGKEQGRAKMRSKFNQRMLSNQSKWR